jgi:hypothetical protein
MRLKCPFCARDIEVADQLPVKAVVACPYAGCQRQFQLALPKSPRVVSPQEVARRYNSGDDLIWRGEYSAWGYVWFGFLLHGLFVGGLSETLLKELQHLPSNEHPLWCSIVSLVLGMLLTSAIFGNRWRRIEKMASRYCCGLVNASLLYVPLIVVGYAYYVAFHLALTKLRSR